MKTLYTLLFTALILNTVYGQHGKAGQITSGFASQNVAQNSKTTGEITWDTDTLIVDSETFIYEKTLVNKQLVPRDQCDNGLVHFAGIVDDQSIDDITITKYTYEHGNTTPVTENTNISLDSNNHFSYSDTIHPNKVSGDSLFILSYKYMIATDSDTLYTCSDIVCGDIYLNCGQSNAQASINTENSLRDVQERAQLNIAYGQNSDYGKYSRCIRLLSNNTIKWGYSNVSGYPIDANPVGAMWIYNQYQIQSKYAIPTCIMTTAVGGTEIKEHLPDLENVFTWYRTTGGSYEHDSCIVGRTLKTIYQANFQNHIKGIYWFQGESDIFIETTKSEYLAMFDTLFCTWKDYFPGYEKTYVVQVHSYRNSNMEYHNRIAEALRNTKTFFPDITTIASNGIDTLKDNIHFTKDGYLGVAQRLLPYLERDFYCRTENLRYIASPDIRRIYQKDTIINSLTERFIILEFNMPVSKHSDDSDVLDILKESFYLFVNSTEYQNFSIYRISGNKVWLLLDEESTQITDVSFAGKIRTNTSLYGIYNNKAYLYNKNAITPNNQHGNGCFTFHEIPVDKTAINNRLFSEHYTLNMTDADIERRSQYSPGKVTSANFPEDIRANEIYTKGNLTLTNQDTITYTAGTSIIFNHGFKAQNGSHLNARAGNTYYAYTTINNCIDCIYNNDAMVKDKAVSNENTQKGPLITDSGIQIFPNPTMGQTTIYFTNHNLKIISIINNFGKQINKFSTHNLNFNFNLDNEPDGLYLIVIETNGKRETFKLIKH